MSQRFFILFSFFFLSIFTYNVNSQEAFHSDKTFFGENVEYFLHTVEAGQTVYSLATMYNVSPSDIYKLNPGSETVIKAGDVLKIPQESGSYFYHTIQPKETLYSVSKKYDMKGEEITAVNPGLSVETFTIGKIIRIPINRVTAPFEDDNFRIQFETNNLLIPDYEGRDIKSLNVALVLPFGLKEGTTSANAASNRFVEYYEGLLIALTELKKKGLSVHLQVHDSGSNDKTIPEILNKPQMKNINLLIGGVNESQVKLLSEFSKDNEIPYVIPFLRSDEMMNNYFSYQINCPHSYIYSKVVSSFIEKHKDSNIIFFSPNSGGNKADFVNILQAELKAKKISFESINTTDKLRSLISSDKNNIFVMGDDSKDSFISMSTPLKLIKESNPNYQIMLFGHPSWQSYEDLYEDFFKLNASFYAPFYANPSNPQVKNFYKKFNRWYSRDLMSFFPKYGILGYDMTMFFIQLLDKHGTAIDTNVNSFNYTGLQSDFKFERINNWGGFINTNVFWVSFNNDYTLSSGRIN